MNPGTAMTYEVYLRRRAKGSITAKGNGRARVPPTHYRPP
jgi:hypothetical protein